MDFDFKIKVLDVIMMKNGLQITALRLVKKMKSGQTVSIIQNMFSIILKEKGFVA